MENFKVFGFVRPSMAATARALRVRNPKLRRPGP